MRVDAVPFINAHMSSDACTGGQSTVWETGLRKSNLPDRSVAIQSATVCFASFEAASISEASVLLAALIFESESMAPNEFRVHVRRQSLR